MSIFDKVREARPTQGGSYFEAGHDFTVMITQVKHQETRSSKEGAFIVETKVLMTDCPTCRVGAERNWFVDLDKDAAAGNLKAFGMAAGEALTGETISADEVDGSDLKALTMDEQPLVGQFMKTSTYNKPTRAGKDFTRHKWFACTPQEAKAAEEVALRLGLIESKKAAAKK